MSSNRPPLRRAFTMVEMMAVVAILVLLLTLVTPTIMGLQVQALEKESLYTVNQIDGAIKMYHADFGAYPPSQESVNYSGWHGRELLVLFLTGYGPDLPVAAPDGTPAANFSVDDGCAGFGFRTTPRGHVYGPYNGTENIARQDSLTGVTVGKPTFVDAFGNEIYYYRFDGGEYHEAHNPGGPIEDSTSPARKYARNPEENDRYFNDRYILCTAGADGLFSPFYTDPKTDDITNFLPK